MRKTILAVLFTLIITGPGFCDDLKCRVKEVINGNSFRCSNGTTITIWGIKAPGLKEKAKHPLRGGIESRDNLKSYIQGIELKCTLTSGAENDFTAKCIKDLEVKQFDIALPQLNGKFAQEIESVTHGYYRLGKYPRGL